MHDLGIPPLESDDQSLTMLSLRYTGAYFFLESPKHTSSRLSSTSDTIRS